MPKPRDGCLVRGLECRNRVSSAFGDSNASPPTLGAVFLRKTAASGRNCVRGAYWGPRMPIRRPETAVSGHGRARDAYIGASTATFPDRAEAVFEAAWQFCVGGAKVPARPLYLPVGVCTVQFQSGNFPEEILACASYLWPHPNCHAA